MATPSTKILHAVDSWCVTKVKAIETKYQWTIEDFNLCMMKKPLDCLTSGIFISKVADDKAIEWQLKLNLKGNQVVNKDHLSLSLCRLDNLKDVKPIVRVRFMIINSKQEVEDIVNFIEESVNGKKLEAPDFIKSNSSILKENQNLSIICFLKIGMNSVKVFSNEDNVFEPNGNDDYPSQIIKDIQTLNGNSNLCDCILTTQGNKFYVQKAILAARSSTFFNMFKNNQNHTEEIEIYNVQLSSDILRELLNFIYTGKAQNIEKSTDDLLRAANEYALPSLKKLCAIYLGKHLCIDNVIDMLVLSVNCDTIHLKQQVIDFMTIHAKNIVTLLKLETFGSLPDNIREEIMRILLQKLE